MTWVRNECNPILRFFIPVFLSSVFFLYWIRTYTQISTWCSPVRYPCFLIEWIFYWIEYSQFQNVESYFELNFVRKQKIESTFELNVVEKWKLNKCLNWIRWKTEKWINVWIEFHWKQDKLTHFILNHNRLFKLNNLLNWIFMK